MAPPGAVIAAFIERNYGHLESPNSRRRGPRTPWTPTTTWGKQRLKTHLHDTYGLDVGRVTDLSGAFRIDHADRPPWIARVFPRARPLEVVEGDAEILRFLEDHRFPAERSAHPQAMSVVEGHPVLVTRFVPGSSPAPSGQVVHAVGELLGRLHPLPADSGAMARPAGAYHLICLEGGGRRDDVAAMMPLLRDAESAASIEHRPLFARLRAELDEIDFCEGLPHALTHIDLGGPNVLKTAEGELTAIDWAGAGRGPRVFSISALKYSAGRSDTLVDAFAAGYRKHAQLDPEELARLGPALKGKLTVSRRIPKTPSATVRVAAVDFVRIAARDVTWVDAINDGRATVDGDRSQISRMYGIG